MNSPALRPSSGSGNRRSGSPAPSSSGSLNNDVLDEQVLRHLVIVSHDIENIIIKVIMYLIKAELELYISKY
jgi:hypothetical protein